MYVRSLARLATSSVLFSLALTLNLSRMPALHVRQLTFIRERQPLSQRKRKTAFLRDRSRSRASATYFSGLAAKL